MDHEDSATRRNHLTFSNNRFCIRLRRPSRHSASADTLAQAERFATALGRRAGTMPSCARHSETPTPLDAHREHAPFFLGPVQSEIDSPVLDRRNRRLRDAATLCKFRLGKARQLACRAKSIASRENRVASFRPVCASIGGSHVRSSFPRTRATPRVPRGRQLGTVCSNAKPSSRCTHHALGSWWRNCRRVRRTRRPHPLVRDDVRSHRIRRDSIATR